jgi:hypothetical protein
VTFLIQAEEFFTYMIAKNKLLREFLRYFKKKFKSLYVKGEIEIEKYKNELMEEECPIVVAGMFLCLFDGV